MEKKPILIIAEEANRAFYRALPLWEEGIEFHPLHAPFSFLQYRDPDLVLVDSGFNARQGLALLGQIKGERPEIPVILLTDSESEYTAIKAFRMGARNYLKKPVDLFDLKASMEELLRIKRSCRENRTPLTITKNAGNGLTGKVTHDTPPNLLRAVQLMEKDLSQLITVDLLASEAGLSRYHFCRVFKKKIGVSPMALVALLRIERAKELLLKGNSISATALEVGFNDLSNFIRHFKRVTRLTPTAYRSSLLAGQ